MILAHKTIFSLLPNRNVFLTTTIIETEYIFDKHNDYGQAGRLERTEPKMMIIHSLVPVRKIWECFLMYFPNELLHGLVEVLDHQRIALPID